MLCCKRLIAFCVRIRCATCHPPCCPNQKSLMCHPHCLPLAPPNLLQCLSVMMVLTTLKLKIEHAHCPPHHRWLAASSPSCRLVTVLLLPVRPLSPPYGLAHSQVVHVRTHNRSWYRVSSTLNASGNELPLLLLKEQR
jgi:hypothetical protein